MSKKEFYYCSPQQVFLKPLVTDGWILDIGGGGEGVIGQLMGDCVIAIDTRMDELLETENHALKLTMNASQLQFVNESFGMVTSFFSLLYIHPDLHQKVFEEVHRVLKPSGSFYLWDVIIPKKPEEHDVFILPLEYTLPTGTTKTTFGVGWQGTERNIEYYKQLALTSGFTVKVEQMNDQVVELVLFKKQESWRRGI